VSNTNAPNGFQDFGRQDGGSPTEGLAVRLISSADTAPVGYGDPVTSQTTGYVSASTVATTQIDGIFYGCEYLSTAVGRVVWSNYWPGSGAASDVKAYIKNDPDTLFVVQSNNTAIVFADIGANIQITVGTPNSTTGFSTAAVAQSLIATTDTLPFRIVGLLSDYAPPGTNGTDNTSAYNRVIVAPNNWDRNTRVGIA
jgi:hypothetical protein